jgi:hypothetical protein
MVLTKSEFIASMQHEVHILLHLGSKIESRMLDYRPTPKQRSTLELLKYLSYMGPVMIEAAKRGEFDRNAWVGAVEAATARDFHQTLAAIAAHRDLYASLIGGMSDEDFRVEIEMFGRRTTRGAFLVNTVLCGYAAYRTQLFIYLKACGREELNTMNLWAGMDTPASV